MYNDLAKNKKRFEGVNWQQEESDVEKQRKISTHLINCIQSKGGTWTRNNDVITMQIGNKKAHVALNASDEDLAKKLAKNGEKFFVAQDVEELEKWFAKGFPMSF